MVSLNIGNVPTPLYHALLELKGKIHARTWVEVLQWALQDPEGEIDFEFLSIDGRPLFDERGRAQFSHKIIFRTGRFVHEFDPSRPKDEQFKQLHYLADKSPRRLEVNVHGKNH